MDQKKLLKFLSLWAGTTILALIISAVFGNKFVLGNASIATPVSGMVLGVFLTVVFFGAEPVAKKFDVKIKDKRAWVGIFFAVNCTLIWILKRLADFSGVGVSGIVFVFIIGAILTGGQYYLDKYLDRFVRKNL